MVTAANMVAKISIFSYQWRQDSEDYMSWLTKKKRVLKFSRFSHTSLLTSFQANERKAVIKDSTTHFMIWTTPLFIMWYFTLYVIFFIIYKEPIFTFRMPRPFLKLILCKKKSIQRLQMIARLRLETYSAAVWALKTK